MAGRAFQFSLDSAAPITVNGGGVQRPDFDGVRESTRSPSSQGAGTLVVAIRSHHMVSRDFAARTATVRALPGSIGREPRPGVVFVNHITGGGGLLKVCARRPATSLLGQPFQFTEDGRRTDAVAGTPGAPGGSLPLHWPSGRS